jgi:hypothetical protein
MQKSPNSDTKVNRDSWSFHSMVEYGRVTREQHKRNLQESQEREIAQYSFTPVLQAKKKPNERPLDRDRGVHMYQKAMMGSKLLSKNRSDKDPLQVDIEKYGSECSFKPKTNSNTNYSKVFKEERAKGAAELSQSPRRKPVY